MSDNEVIRRGDVLALFENYTGTQFWVQQIATIPLDPRVEKLVEALAGLVACQGDDPCRYDHHGYCQEHYIEAECSVAKARAALTEGTKE